MEKEFKRLNELTNEDCKNFKVVKVILRHNISKDYGDSYTAETIVGPYHLKFRKNFSEINYHQILMAQHKFNPSSINEVNAYARWTKGISKNNSEYHQLQLIFGKDTFLTRMISDAEYKLFNTFIQNKLLTPIDWIEVPVNVGIEETVDLDIE